MTTTQPTKNPYTFSKDAWHCRLFKWCYGVNPPDVFKTMYAIYKQYCPIITWIEE